MKKTMQKVVIVLGSKSDMAWADKIVKHCATWKLPSQVRIASAHKSPEYALSIVREYEKSSEQIVFIAVAGRSNALGGFLDANTRFPVINCPPSSASFAGLDILSSLRMPSGVAPATVLEPDQAALLSAKIFALQNEELARAIKNYHETLVGGIKKDDLAVRK